MFYTIKSVAYNATATVNGQAWDAAGPESWIEVTHQDGRKDEYLKRLWARQIERYA